MRAISLWNPFGYLWLLPGEKEFETRGWPTAHCGPLLIHAALNRGPAVRSMLASPLVEDRLSAHGLTVNDLAFGALIGMVDLVGCHPMERLPLPSVREAAFGDWGPGRFAWQRGPSPVLFSKPIPWKGKQGFFQVPDEVLREVLP